MDRQRGRRNTKMRVPRVQLQEGQRGGKVIGQLKEVDKYIKISRIFGYEVTDQGHI